jgi:outer membrane protein assembly factor BamB
MTKTVIQNPWAAVWNIRNWRFRFISDFGFRISCFALACGLVVLSCTGVCDASDWRHFRGTDNTSVSGEKNLPTRFGPTENVAWKAPLPGTGPSSPIVAAGRVIVTAATGPRQERLHVLSFDAATGRLRWERRLWATGPTLCNPFGGIAAPTPASDGRLVFAFFSSNDLACFDLDGNLQWLRGVGYESPTTRNDVGMASSPLVVGDTVIVQLENPGKSFVMGIDAATGQSRWQIDRAWEPTWTSPTLLRGRPPAPEIVLIQSRSRLTGVEPRTGKVAFDYEAGCSTLSSPAAAGDRVYVAADGLSALRYDPARRGVALLWKENRLRCENVSPVVHGGRVYAIRDSGILVCGDADSGKTLWQLRLKGPIWATPVIAGGRLYAVSYHGLVQVVQLGNEGTLVGKGQIDSGILASPAVADGAIYFRSNRFLWRTAISRQQSAISHQQSAISPQQSAISRQQSAISREKYQGALSPRILNPR